MRYLRTPPIPAVLISVTLAACAGTTLDTGDLGKTRETTAGAVLVDSKGKTLYTYDRDAVGQSNCTGACAVAWPPAEATAGAMATGQFSIVMRSGATRQWAYKGKPLYGYIKDSKPGDITGDGDDGIWHAAKP